MILLSFDTEEFDVPREHGVELSFDQMVNISIEGTTKILDCLKEMGGIRATFFCTADFAEHAPEIMSRIANEGHEIASHGCSHWSFKTEDLYNSKKRLETLTGLSVVGYRQARMMPVDEKDIAKAGYIYNSSLNPTCIPGRYMHLSTPRIPFMKEGVLQIPASVTPWVRFPLFWLSYHNLPAWLYRAMARRTLRHDGHLSIYFHPWEFYELKEHPELKMPFIIYNNSGEKMVNRLRDLISDLKCRGYQFGTYQEFANKKLLKLTSK